MLAQYHLTNKKPQKNLQLVLSFKQHLQKLNSNITKFEAQVKRNETSGGGKVQKENLFSIQVDLGWLQPEDAYQN